MPIGGVIHVMAGEGYVARTKKVLYAQWDVRRMNLLGSVDSDLGGCKDTDQKYMWIDTHDQSSTSCMEKY